MSAGDSPTGVPSSAGFGLDRDAVAAVAGSGRALAWAMRSGGTRALRFDEQGALVEDAVFGMAGLELRLPQGCRIAGGDGSVEVSAAGGAVPAIGRAGAPGHPLDRPVRIDERGRVELRAVLPADLVTASVRYFYGGPSAGDVRVLDYPAFEAPGDVEATVTIDPADPADPERNAVVPEVVAPIATRFVSTVGQPVSLGLVSDHRSRLVPQWDPVAESTYLAPGGDWRLVAPTGPSGPAPVDFLLGLSALEYARAADASTVRFVPNQPCYAANFGPSGPSGPVSLTATCPGSEYPVTTSWLYLDEPASEPSDAAGTPYFSQPKDAGMFTLAAGDPVLHQLDLQATALPPQPEDSRASFPAAPYAGVAPPAGGEAWAATLRRFEEQALAPTRALAIQALTGAAAARPLGASGTTAAVTPQGLYSEFADDGATWSSLVLASSELGAQRLRFERLTGPLRTAMLASQLFLVISSPAKLAAAGDLLGGIAMDDWTFDLAPSQWSTDPPTILIVKFSDEDIATLAADPSLWTEGPAFNDDLQATSQALQAIVANAAAGGAYFAETVIHDWNGVLALNCPVPGGDFPPELRGLAAGMKGTLVAHHVGVNGAPIQVDGRLATGDSSMFGLIDYSDEADLTYGTDPYDFKVLSLRVAFANSHVASFSSQVELLVAKLFGERSTIVGGKRGDNILFDGTWQRHGDESSYSFRSTGPNLFSIQSDVVSSVTVATAEFATVDPGATDVRSIFNLAGTIRFAPLQQLDLFSFGLAGGQPATIDSPGLVYSNLVVSMDQAGTAKPTFAFDARGAVIDLARSTARPGSVYARLPLAVTGFAQSGDSKSGGGPSKPADLGYKGVSSPLTPGPLGGVWFGLAMDLDLGSAGGLAAASGLNAGMLAAWSPSDAGYNVQIGLRLPGAQAGSGAIPLMGPLKLDVGAIALLDDPASGGYMLRVAQVALGFLGVKFPPGGAINLLLFGNPDPQATTNRLGWYAAYKKDTAAGANGQKQLPSARRRELPR